MNNLTYPECLAHIRQYKDFYCLKTIAEKIDMSPAYFRNVINERYGLKNLPYKNTRGNIKQAKITEFVNIERNNSIWFYGIVTVTNAKVWYPLHISIQLEQHNK